MVIAYTERPPASFEITQSGTWIEFDLSLLSNPPTAGSVAEIVIGNYDGVNELEAGVREDGSVLNRKVDIVKAEAGGESCVTMFVQVSDDSKIEAYAEDKNNVYFRIVGWFTGCTFIEEFQSLATAGPAGWDDRNIFSSYGVPKGRVVSVCAGNSVDDATRWVGVRTIHITIFSDISAEISISLKHGLLKNQVFGMIALGPMLI